MAEHQQGAEIGQPRVTARQREVAARHRGSVMADPALAQTADQLHESSLNPGRRPRC